MWLLMMDQKEVALVMVRPFRNNVMSFVEDFENYNVPNLHKVGMGESTRPKRLKFLEEKKEIGCRLRITA